jgi:hypothetical protein
MREPHGLTCPRVTQAAAEQALSRLASGKQQLEAQLAAAVQQHASAEQARQGLEQQLRQLQEQSAQGQQAAQAAARQQQQDWATRAHNMVQEALQQKQAEHEAQLSQLKGRQEAEQAAALEELQAGWELERAAHQQQLERATQEAGQEVEAVRRQYSQLLQDQASAASLSTQELQDHLRWVPPAGSSALCPAVVACAHCTPKRPAAALLRCRAQWEGKLAEAVQAQQQLLQQAAQQHEQELAALRNAAFEAHEQHQQQLQEAARAADRRLDEQAAQLRGGYEARVEQLRQQQEAERRAQQVGGGVGCRVQVRGTGRAFARTRCR